MKKFYVLIIGLCLIIFAGCFPAIINAPVGGVSPSLLMTDVTYPSKWTSEGLRHSIRGSYQYKIIGPISVTVESSNVLGLVAQGNGGYKKLLDKAKNMGADNIINVVVDTKYSYFIFGLFQKVTTNLYGMAVKYVPVKPAYKPVKKTFKIPQVKINKPDKSKKYYINLSGQQYGPISYSQIEELKKMGFVNNNSKITDPQTKEQFRISDF